MTYENNWPLRRMYCRNIASYMCATLRLDFCILEDSNFFYLSVSVPTYCYTKTSENSDENKIDSDENEIDSDKLESEVYTIRNIINLIGDKVFNKFVTLDHKTKQAEFSHYGIDFKLPKLEDPKKQPAVEQKERQKITNMGLSATTSTDIPAGDSIILESDWKQLCTLKGNSLPNESSRLLATILWFSIGYQSNEQN
ncbi:uncharacterized protein LOC135832689 [Planococcus citri]|uniref:uncharacterized protein LOC135832689 n=1 Tax=Planococcus citri TaxID=170843 RepID=UPI0031F7964E